MKVALHTPFAASSKEQLAKTAGRVRKAFLDARLGEPSIRFTLIDAPEGRGVSAIDRVLKRHPEMERFITHRPLISGSKAVRMFSNSESGERCEYALLKAIAEGVPRSYPFRGVALHFHAPEFGERLIGLPAVGHSLPGVLITDNWWVTGRQRSLSVYTVYEASLTDKKLPRNPKRVDAVIKACGKAKKPVQLPIPKPGGGLVTSIPEANQEAVKAVNADFHARIAEVVAAANMPNNLPPTADVVAQGPAVLAGPRRAALEAAFKPMKYVSHGGTGEFHLTRKTKGNLTVQLYLDVGTWSHMVSADFTVSGAGFKASLGIPVAPGIFGQYPIGDAAQWRKIVENLAAMVRELDRNFVPAVEQAAGPTPAWYEPGG